MAIETAQHMDVFGKPVFWIQMMLHFIIGVIRKIEIGEVMYMTLSKAGKIWIVC